MAICKNCERDTSQMTTVKGGKIRLNKKGICAVCVEVNEEIAFEDKERLREARALVARADRA